MLHKTKRYNNITHSLSCHFFKTTKLNKPCLIKTKYKFMLKKSSNTKITNMNSKNKIKSIKMKKKLDLRLKHILSALSRYRMTKVMMRRRIMHPTTMPITTDIATGSEKKNSQLKKKQLIFLFKSITSDSVLKHLFSTIYCDQVLIRGGPLILALNLKKNISIWSM